MKKLMIALAITSMAICAQAVQVKWISGVLYTPGSDGSVGAKWDGSKWTYSQSKISAKGSVTAIIWESTTSLSSSAGNLYAAYKGGDTDNLFTGATVYKGDNASNASLINISGGSSYSAKDTAYAAILYVLTDGSSTWYMENYSSVEVGASTTSKNYLANFVGGGAGTASSTALSWTSASSSPVPEPTSTMLLVLGLCGLALKRKQV